MIASYFFIVTDHFYYFPPIRCSFLPDNYNYVFCISYLLNNFKKVGQFFLFIVGGIVAIIVGSFMIRGTMHLWDKPNSEKNSENNND